MKFQRSRYLFSFVICLAFTIAVAALASIPNCSSVGILLLPGMLAGAIVFPEGTKSDFPAIYMLVAALANGFIFSWPVLGLWVLIERIRQRDQMTGDTR